MDQEKLKEIAAKSAAEVKAAAQDLSRVKGFNLTGLKGLVSVAPLIVKHVEAIGAQEGLAGADKKALAVEFVLQLVPLPSWLPEVAARWILNFVIERAVAAFKA